MLFSTSKLKRRFPRCRVSPAIVIGDRRRNLYSSFEILPFRYCLRLCLPPNKISLYLRLTLAFLSRLSYAFFLLLCALSRPYACAIAFCMINELSPSNFVFISFLMFGYEIPILNLLYEMRKTLLYFRRYSETSITLDILHFIAFILIIYFKLLKTYVLFYCFLTDLFTLLF